MYFQLLGPIPPTALVATIVLLSPSVSAAQSIHTCLRLAQVAPLAVSMEAPLARGVWYAAGVRQQREQKKDDQPNACD